MKKSLALLLSLVLTAGLLSACGRGETPAPSSSMPDEPAVSVIAPVEEPEPEPEPEPQPPTAEDITLDMLAEHEERLCMLEITTNAV